MRVMAGANEECGNRASASMDDTARLCRKCNSSAASSNHKATLHSVYLDLPASGDSHRLGPMLTRLRGRAHAILNAGAFGDSHRASSAESSNYAKMEF